MTLASVRARTARYVKLSWREIDLVAQLLKDGADNATLARRLGVDTETAKSHIRAAMRKTEMPNRTALAVAVLQQDIVIVDPNSRVVRF